MPILYIFAASVTIPINVIINKPIDSKICQTGTPKGIRISITIGDVKGNIEKPTAIELCGLSIMVIPA